MKFPWSRQADHVLTLVTRAVHGECLSETVHSVEFIMWNASPIASRTFFSWTERNVCQQTYFMLCVQAVNTSLKLLFSSVEFKMRSTPSLRSFPNFAFERVPMFVWLTMALSRPFKEDRLALPLSTPLSSRRLLWCMTISAQRLLKLLPCRKIASFVNILLEVRYPHGPKRTPRLISHLEESSEMYRPSKKVQNV